MHGWPGLYPKVGVGCRKRRNPGVDADDVSWALLYLSLAASAYSFFCCQARVLLSNSVCL